MVRAIRKKAVWEASEEHPYLALVLDLDPTMVGSVMVEAGHVPSRTQSAVTAIDISSLDAGLLDAAVRLVRLLDTLAQARFLTPHISREIIYRLLIGAQGARLSQVAAPGGSTYRITEAIEWLRRSTHGRIVLVSSGAGSHGDQQFGLTTNRGSVASYGISKAAVNALTAKLAAELNGSGVLVNAVCPGLTATAPGMEAFGARPVSEGAASVVWAATLSDDGSNGGFFRDGMALPW